MVEIIMKMVNEDKKTMFSIFDEFSQSHIGVKRKLLNLQTISDKKYFCSIQDPSILSMIIQLSSI